MSDTNTNFRETQTAAQLLDHFHALTHKPVKRLTRSGTEAAAVFFSKDFLTISDFFGPIGEVLVVASTEKQERNSTVSQFITSNLHRTKKKTLTGASRLQNKKETIGDFLLRLK